MSKVTPQPEVDAATLGQLACPACHGDLRIDAAWLVCAGCGRAYPVVDGIPVLIVERAEAAAGGLTHQKKCIKRNE